MQRSKTIFLVSIIVSVVLGVVWYTLEVPRVSQEVLLAESEFNDPRAQQFAQIVDTVYKEKNGGVKEYYQAADLVKIFPGIKKEDFTAVELTTGKYHVDQTSFYPEIDESLVRLRGPDVPLGITLQGYQTLMNNVETRLKLGQESTAEEISNYLRIRLENIINLDSPETKTSSEIDRESLGEEHIKILTPMNKENLNKDLSLSSIVWQVSDTLSGCNYETLAVGDTEKLVLGSGAVSSTYGTSGFIKNDTVYNPKKSGLVGQYKIIFEVICTGSGNATETYSDFVIVNYR